MNNKALKSGAARRRRCRPLRFERPGQLQFVTCRVTEGRFWLHPILSCCLTPLNHKARRICKAFERRAEREVRALVAEANKRMGPCQARLTVSLAKLLLKDLVGACLARAQQRCREEGQEVDLFGFVAMSNHVHLLVRTRGKNLAAFMRYFSSTLTSGINYLTGKRGSLFGRRYDAQPVLDDNAATGRLSYVVDNPRSAGLVADYAEWPGQLLCFGLGASDTPTFRFFNRNAWHQANRPSDLMPFIESITLTLSPLPHLSSVERDAYRRAIDGWIGELRNDAQRKGDRARATKPNAQERDRRAARRIAAVVTSPIGYRPDELKRTRRPYAFGSAEMLRQYRVAIGTVMSLHEAASDGLRGGDRNVIFPEGTYAPPVVIAA